MNQESKDKLLSAVRERLAYVRGKIQLALGQQEVRESTMSKDATRMSGSDAIVQRRLIAHFQEQAGNFKQLYPSPYFTFCEFEKDGEIKPMYFGKFSFRDEGIYSWITPAATLRFEKPGPASYMRPDGTVQTGIIHRKDQYLIVDGKVLFFATEGDSYSRELIYQEHFTRQKQGFVLPEVVEQMEKAQDQVVRAEFRGPLVISGPAGSGKTTLALHRVAYLLQSPETAEYFPIDSILVLVQDVGTKEYFSHLLPELGIRGVTIVTFGEWALGILNLPGFTYARQIDMAESERFAYEHAKLSALRSGSKFVSDKKPAQALERFYGLSFTAEQKKLWQQQMETKTFDRFDLTILLQAQLATTGQFTVEKEYYEELKSGKYRKKTSLFPVKNNLMIIDEFQNYLPEQIKILKSTLNHRIDSVVYVGDMAQQTQLGTLRDWKSIDEDIKPERLVTLQKVYRNTKQILTYIRNLGYTVVIPDGIKEGKPVAEQITASVGEEIEFIQQIIPTTVGQTLGILAPEKMYLEEFRKYFSGQESIHCLTFQESQGVEFDVVVLVGITPEFSSTDHLPEAVREEVKKIRKDLLYVALTRAMGELYIVGKNLPKLA